MPGQGGDQKWLFPQPSDLPPRARNNEATASVWSSSGYLCRRLDLAALRTAQPGWLSAPSCERRATGLTRLASTASWRQAIADDLDAPRITVDLQRELGLAPHAYPLRGRRRKGAALQSVPPGFQRAACSSARLSRRRVRPVYKHRRGQRLDRALQLLRHGSMHSELENWKQKHPHRASSCGELRRYRGPQPKFFFPPRTFRAIHTRSQCTCELNGTVQRGCSGSFGSVHFGSNSHFGSSCSKKCESAKGGCGQTSGAWSC